MKIGAIAIMPYKSGFLGIECAKGRGIILPGGTFERSKDQSYHHTAQREALEEVNVISNLRDIHYLACLPDGDEYMTFAFWCPRWQGTPKESKEGKPVVATWDDLLCSRYAPYYHVLHEMFNGDYLYPPRNPKPAVWPFYSQVNND